MMNINDMFEFGLCSILQGASITLHTILLEVGGTIYNNRTLELFKELDFDSQRVEKIASKLHVHSVNYAATLAHTRRALSSTMINSHQSCRRRFQIKPATLMIPIDLYYFQLVKELFLFFS